MINQEILDAIFVSLIVSLSSVLISFIIGSFFAYLILKYNLRKLNFTLQVLSSIPPVIAGLIVFLLFSNAGIFGFFENITLYTIYVMVIAQCILIIPLYTSVVTSLNQRDFQRQLFTLNMLSIKGLKKFKVLLWENRIIITQGISTGFSRGISEVGAVLLVGGNIKYETRTMTTYIATETSKGNYQNSIIIGIILLLISLLVNLFIISLKKGKENHE